MSIKFLSNYSTGEVKTFSSVEELFDPRVNTLWDQSTLPTTGGYLSILKSLYCKENMENHPKLLFHSGAFQEEQNYSELFRKKVLEVVPEDRLWAIGFLPMSIGRDGKVAYSIYTGRSRYEGERRAMFRYDDDYGSLRVGVTSDVFGNYLLEKINKVADSWLPLWEAAKDMPFDYGDNVSQGLQFINKLLQMISNKKYIYEETSHSYKKASDYVTILGQGVTPHRILEDNGFFQDVRFKIMVTDSYREPIHTLLNYSANIYDILGGALLDKGENEENTPLYGVELELSTDYSVRELVEAGKNAFMACKSDGSVNGSKRYFYECVTRPMSLKMQKKQWAYFFHKLDYDKFDTTKQTNNGMHVHVSRKAFIDKIHLHKFTWFFTSPSHRDFMFAMSERNETSFEGYSPMPAFSGSTKGKAFVQVLNEVQRLRGAVNLKKGPTVEVRLFRGVVSFASVMKNLEFVDSILHFTEEHSINRMSLREYYHWLMQLPKNRYVVLKKYFEEMNIAKYFVASDVKEVVFTEKDANKILKLCNNSGIKFTQEHIDILNKDHPDTFYLEDGKLILNPKFINTFASMDRIFEANILRHFR